MLYDNWWFDVIPTIRDRKDDELHTWYEKKIWTIVLPIHSEQRDLQMLPNIVDFLEPKAEILKKSHGDIAHLFVGVEFLSKHWLDESFWELYIWATRNAPFYNNPSKQWEIFLHKYVQAVSQTALKSELLRQKMHQCWAEIKERGDDFYLIWTKELQPRFMRKISDVGIYKQYEEMSKVVPTIDTLSMQLVTVLDKQRKDIRFGTNSFVKKALRQDTRLN